MCDSCVRHDSHEVSHDSVFLHDDQPLAKQGYIALHMTDTRTHGHTYVHACKYFDVLLCMRAPAQASRSHIRACIHRSVPVMGRACQAYESHARTGAMRAHTRFVSGGKAKARLFGRITSPTVYRSQDMAAW